jgi:hypothetical protein
MLRKLLLALSEFWCSYGRMFCLPDAGSRFHTVCIISATRASAGRSQQSDAFQCGSKQAISPTPITSSLNFSARASPQS